jgi:polyhydroxyalkanoate synthesis regulator phasin|tara:strand:- start:703 stop:954 length:252 start_codon:yes stop_codon:yes gene_type:complete
MTKSKFVFDKLAKIFEQGLISYKDLSNEILNILKSKRDEIIFKMKITSKEETDILSKRVEELEKEVNRIKNKKKVKIKRVKKS